MRTRNLVGSVLIVALLYGAAPAEARPKRFSYAGSYAGAYAHNNAATPYGPRQGQGPNPFHSFSNNCANFVSQAIIAGMILRTTPAEVYARRSDFSADSDTASSRPKWYFLDINHRGPAWSGAKEMYEYAKNSKTSNRGLHFVPVDSDTPSKRSLDPFDLWPGDVIFCDWEDDKKIDHVIMVWKIDFFPFIFNKYNRIRVAYQSNVHADWTLQQVIDESHRQNKKWASFKVYRPVDYYQDGR